MRIDTWARFGTTSLLPSYQILHSASAFSKIYLEFRRLQGAVQRPNGWRTEKEELQPAYPPPCSLWAVRLQLAGMAGPVTL